MSKLTIAYAVDTGDARARRPPFPSGERGRSPERPPKQAAAMARPFAVRADRIENEAGPFEIGAWVVDLEALLDEMGARRGEIGACPSAIDAWLGATDL